MLEYLILNGKFEAAKHYRDNSQTTLREELINQFNKGNRTQFMNLFGMLHKQSKLQFYIRVYFLIYSIHPALRGKGSIPEPQKIAFKDYLDNKGAELAKTNQFLEFYALPFIKKPLEHLAFKNLFKKEWVAHLKEKLQLFIAQQQRLLKNEVSKLFEQSSLNNSNAMSSEAKVFQQKTKQMQKINKKLFEEVKQFTQKYHILEENHKNMIDGFHTHMMESQSKWFQITKQLVSSSKTLLQMLINSDSVHLGDRRFIKAKKRIQKYEKFVNKKFDDLLSQSQDISIFERPSINQLSYSVTPHTQKSILPNNNLSNYVFSYIASDFTRMKNTIKRGTAQQKISIINGLYWRILKSKQKQTRKLNILGILHHNVLNIGSGQFQQMLASRQLMKPIMRLLQLISLDGHGKRILFNNNDLHKDLIGIVTQCQDPQCLEYIIDTLGQISSTSSFKLQLIKEDIIEVCVGILRSNKYENNQNILQNTVAILLNMLEKDEGLKKFQREKDIFQIFKRYIKNKFKIARALIYGIIYALLESEELFKRAHAQKMPQFFDNILSIDPQINKIQLSYLKNKLMYFQPKQNEEVQAVDENDLSISDAGQFQVYDYEIPEHEQMIKNHQDLLQNYVLKGKQAAQQIQQVKQVLSQYKQHKLPRFNSLDEPKKIEKVQKIQSPQTKPTEQSIKTPYIKQLKEPQKSAKSQRPMNKKVNNYFENDTQNIHQEPKIKERRSNRIVAQKPQVQRENRRLQKSISEDKRIGKSFEKDKFIYQSNKFPNNKVSQFKAAQQKNYRSPQQNKKPREEVLKQLNEQIKQQRESQITSLQPNKNGRNQDQGQAFQSKPKLRRTPPKQ